VPTHPHSQMQPQCVVYNRNSLNAVQAEFDHLSRRLKVSVRFEHTCRTHIAIADAFNLRDQRVPLAQIVELLEHQVQCVGNYRCQCCCALRCECHNVAECNGRLLNIHRDPLVRVIFQHLGDPPGKDLRQDRPIPPEFLLDEVLLPMS
jgi:hypothetical protein